MLFFWYESRMQQRGRTRIAHDAHLGGALVGLAWTIFAKPEALDKPFIRFGPFSARPRQSTMRYTSSLLLRMK